jgi:hypothetical protein
MPTENTAANSVISERLQRMESSIEELNARIARLAIALGVSLDSEHDVQRVMARKSAPPPAPLPPQAVERRTDRRQSALPFSGLDRRSGTDRRLSYKWEELRGLLVLRYGVEKTYVEQVGLTATRHIMVSAEQHLTRDGFRPGADGMDLKHLLDDN